MRTLHSDNPARADASISASLAEDPISSNGYQGAPPDEAAGRRGADGDITRQRVLASATAGLLSLLLFLWALPSTVTYTGDCGELISASYRLGIAHPSGYPLYCMLGRTFASLVPFGEAGWRYNLLSALLGAGMAAFITATVHRLTVPRSLAAGTQRSTAFLYDHWPAIAAGLLLAGYYDVGTQCIIAEVQALEGCLEAAMLYCAVAWHQDRDWRWLYSLALVAGLGIVAHLTSVFLLPGLLLYTVVQHRGRFREFVPRVSPGLRWATLLGLPLAIYALTIYLPLRSHLYPEPSPPKAWFPLDWTHPVDFPRWLTHVTARQYRVHLLTPHTVTVAGHVLHIPWFVKPLSTVPGQLMDLLHLLLNSFMWLTPLFLWGAVVTLQRGTSTVVPRGGGRWLGVMLLLACVLNIGVEINYDVGDQTNFFFPAYMAMSVWMGLGLAALFRIVEDWVFTLTPRRGEGGDGEPFMIMLPRVLLVSILISTVIVQWDTFISVGSLHGATDARDSALERAAAAEQLARATGKTPVLLLMEDDSLWGFWYAHYVLDRAPQVKTPWGPIRNQLAGDGRLIDIVHQQQASGPLAVNAFDAEVDRQYPYVPLTASGNLWLLSHRALPMPATPAQPAPGESPAPCGLVTARFRRTPLTQARLANLYPGDLSSVSGALLKRLGPLGLAVLKRDDTAMLDVDFVVTPAMLKQLPIAPHDRTNGTAQAGWIEVLMGKHDALKGAPSPAAVAHKQDSKYLAWTQARRLILPLGARSGAPYHAEVPLQIEGDAFGATFGTLYQVWTRITLTPHDRVTPWRQTDLARLVIVNRPW